MIHHDALLCVLCDFHKQDCTFVEAPQPRNRKAETDEQKNVRVKKKYVGEHLDDTLNLMPLIDIC